MANSKNLRNVFSYHNFVHATSGAAGSIVAMTAFYPLDTIRHRLQLEENSKKVSKSTIAMLIQLLQEEGIGSVYRGLIPVLQSLCISNFIYFFTFHGLKTFYGQVKQAAYKDLLLGSVAGWVNVLTTTPFWVVNTRLKMKGVSGEEGSLAYDNLFDGLKYVYKLEGIKGLWAGTMPSLILVLNPAIQFMTYESLKRRYMATHSSMPATISFGIGAIAKAVATFFTYPLQLVQTRLRHGKKNKESTEHTDIGLIKMLMQIINKQGVLGLYRGFEAKLWQTVLTAALMFMAYEKIARFVTSLLIRNQNRPKS